MRVIRIENEIIVKPAFEKELYFLIWRIHAFAPMPECEFCFVCNHSRYIHMEYASEGKNDSRIR